MRRAANKEIVKCGVAVRAHDNVVGVELVGLFRDVHHRRSAELSGFNDQSFLRQAFLGRGELPRGGSLTDRSNFHDVVHQRRVLSRKNGRLDHREEHNPSVDRLGEGHGSVDDGIAHFREIDRGKDRFHEESLIHLIDFAMQRLRSSAQKLWIAAITTTIALKDAHRRWRRDSAQAASGSGAVALKALAGLGLVSLTGRESEQRREQ